MKSAEMLIEKPEVSAKVAPVAHAHERNQRKIVVRSHTPVIYYYPSILMALLCGLMVSADGSGVWAGLFLTTFFANTVVVLFDFNSLRTLFLGLVTAVLGLLIWHFGLGWLISESLSLLHVRMNSHAFFTFAGFFGFLILCDFVWAHLNRWEFSANEVKHIQTFAGHSTNYPGRALNFRVLTTDVFERLILGAGTMVLLIGKKRVRLQNVILAHHKVKELEKFVRSTGVFADDADVFGEDGEDGDGDE